MVMNSNKVSLNENISLAFSSLPGLLSGKDVLAAFQDADLFVLPYRANTFPVVIMES